MKYNINKNFFKKPEKWTQGHHYFLGWLLSDGTISTNRISISLQESDKKMLNILSNIIKYDGPLLFQNREGKTFIQGKECYCQNRYFLHITRKEIFEDLQKIQNFNNKSKSLDFPNYLNKKHIKHFLRAYYEGDGTISHSISSGRMFFNINLTGTISFLKTTEIYLKSIGIKNTKITKKENLKDTHGILKVSGLLNALIFFNHFYADAVFCLRRKLEKFFSLIEYSKSNIPKRQKEAFVKNLNSSLKISEKIKKDCIY